MSRAAEEMRERAQKLALRRLAALREKADSHQGEVHRIVQCGWSFAISVNDYGRRAPDGSDHYHLSAMLVPAGRGSEKHDWHFLGQALGVLTRMSEPLDPVTPIETTHPNAVHHWSWTPTGYDVVSEARKALAVMHPDLSAPPEGRSALWRAAQRAIGLFSAKPDKSASERAAEKDVRLKADLLWEEMTEEERIAAERLNPERTAAARAPQAKARGGKP